MVFIVKQDMVEVLHLTKQYGPLRAIDNLNFSIPKGCAMGLLGSNGAGKTTTLKILTGHLSPSSGDVKVNGKDFSQETKKHIGYLPETPPVYEDLKVSQYLQFVAQLKGVTKKETSKSIDRVVELLDLKEVENVWTQNLSKGYRQRVGLAQALVAKPELLILDEPMSGLDPKQISQLREIFLELKKEHTLLISSHRLYEISSFCDEVIILNKGKQVLSSPLKDLLNKEEEVEIEIKVSHSLSQDRLKKQNGVRSVSYNEGVYLLKLESKNCIEHLARFVVEEGAGLQELVHKKRDLEEIFLNLTKEPETF